MLTHQVVLEGIKAELQRLIVKLPHLARYFTNPSQTQREKLKEGCRSLEFMFERVFSS